MKKRRRKHYRKKILTSLFLAFINAALFISSTYAWFTSTANVRGNKIFAGNLFVDVVTDADGMASIGFDTTDYEDFKTYTRTYFASDGDSKTYYILTNEEAPIINLYNVEPGQGYPVRLQVLNSGDLAIKYTAGFQIHNEDPDDPTSHIQSYTGLETLEKQHDHDDLDFQVFHNKYLVEGGSIDRNREYVLEEYLSDEEYERRLSKLESMQANPNKTKGEEGYDLGGHLEDVLEVYCVDPTSLNDGDVLRSAVKEENYIGTVKQIINVSDPTYTPSTTEEAHELEVVKENINNLSTGFCLPQEVLKDDNGYVLENGVNVNIYDNAAEEPIEVKEGISELGFVDYVIFMPESADNKYQNAALFLDIGVTATQVEFEFDGLDYMIYDRVEVETPEPEPEPGPSTINFYYNDSNTKFTELDTDDETFVDSDDRYTFEITGTGVYDGNYVIKTVTNEHTGKTFQVFRSDITGNALGILYNDADVCELVKDAIIGDKTNFKTLYNAYHATGVYNGDSLADGATDEEIYSAIMDIYYRFVNPSFTWNDKAIALVGALIDIVGEYYVQPGDSITDGMNVYVYSTIRVTSS